MLLANIIISFMGLICYILKQFPNTSIGFFREAGNIINTILLLFTNIHGLHKSRISCV